MFNHNGDGDIPVRAALYARVSSEEQKQGQNIQSQLDQGSSYTEMFNLRLVDSFIDEAVSGTVPLNERPEGIRLLEAARDKKFDVVIVYRLDRLARKLKVLLDGWEELDSLGVGVRSMTEPLDTSNPLGRFVMQLLGSIAELERETILERTRDGREASVRRGHWPGGPAPMGYRLIKEELPNGKQGRTLLEVEDRESEIVRQVFDLYVNGGMSLVKVATYLNSQDVPTAMAIRQGRDSSWVARSVHAIIQNPTYKGEFSFYRRENRDSRQEVTASVPAIVDEETWETAQLKRAQNLASSPRNSKRLYLLRGIPKCGLCGRTCVGDGHAKTNKFYYICNAKRPGNSRERCPGVRIRAEVLEHFVWEDIKEFAHNPGKVTDLLAEKIKRDLANTSGVQVKVDELDKSVEVIEQRRQWLISNASRGLISDEEAESGLLETQQELQAIQVRRQTLRGQIDLGDMQSLQVGQVEAMLATLKDKTKDADADDATKQGMMEQLVNTMVLTPGEGSEVKVSMNYRFAPPEDRVTFTTTTRRPCPQGSPPVP